jgi:threonine dehydratase
MIAARQGADAAMRLPFSLVLRAADIIRQHLTPTPLRNYAVLDAQIGFGIRVWVKHENHQPTNAFKVRNALAAIGLLDEAERRAGVICASTGSHGLGLAWAAAKFGITATVLVPLHTAADKIAAIRAYGGRVIPTGESYDEALDASRAVAKQQGLALIEATNCLPVLAGAATIALEMLAQGVALDSLVLAIGGGSHALGAIVVSRQLRQGLPIYGVQAERASAIHDSWHQRRPIKKPHRRTIAEGLATTQPYEFTFSGLCDGLAGFVAATEEELAAAWRLLVSSSHNLAEVAGAAGVAGILKLREILENQQVGIVLTGANISLEMVDSMLRSDSDGSPRAAGMPAICSKA